MFECMSGQQQTNPLLVTYLHYVSISAVSSITHRLVDSAGNSCPPWCTWNRQFQTQALTWAGEQSCVWPARGTVAAVTTDWPELFLHHETVNYAGIRIPCPDRNLKKLRHWLKVNQLDLSTARDVVLSCLLWRNGFLFLSGTSQWCLLEGPLLSVPLLMITMVSAAKRPKTLGPSC